MVNYKTWSASYSINSEVCTIECELNGTEMISQQQKRIKECFTLIPTCKL